MKRILNVATASLLTVFTLGGIYFPSSPVMLLASTSQQFTFVRLSILIILLSLLFYQPPRTAVFRAGLVVIAGILGFSTVSMINNYTLMLFDALIFIEVVVLLLLEAAELGVRRQEQATSGTDHQPRAKRSTLQTV